ncbi:MAG: SRPBCC family protein, partial [Mycobacteriales bacterium]
FMEGVSWVEQLDDRRTRWTTSIGGVEREFDAEITEQHPDERVAWRSTSGPSQAGVVTFHRLSDDSTRVHLQLEFQPEGVTENLGAMTGAVGHRIEGDLARFKEFIESPGGATGGWRGDIAASPQRADSAGGQVG